MSVGDDLGPRQDLAMGDEDVRSRGEAVKDDEEVRLKMFDEEEPSSTGLPVWGKAGVDMLSCCAHSACLRSCDALLSLYIVTDRPGQSGERPDPGKAGLLAVGLFAVWLSSSLLMITKSSGMSACDEAVEARCRCAARKSPEVSATAAAAAVRTCRGPGNCRRCGCVCSKSVNSSSSSSSNSCIGSKQYCPCTFNRKSTAALAAATTQELQQSDTGANDEQQ